MYDSPKTMINTSVDDLKISLPYRMDEPEKLNKICKQALELIKGKEGHKTREKILLSYIKKTDKLINR